MKSSLYNEKIIEKKVQLFDRIEKILNTNFIHEELDRSVEVLFEEYLKMCNLEKVTVGYITNGYKHEETHRIFNDDVMYLYRHFNKHLHGNITTNHMLCHFSNIFINKLFEGYKPAITNTINSRSVTIHMDDISDNRNEYKFIRNFNNPTVCDDLYFLYDLLMDINDRRMYYIYRGIIESLNLSYYYNDNDDKSIKIEIEHVTATDNINFERLSYTTYGMTTLNCECNKGRFKAVFDSKSTYNKPLDFHTRCREYNNLLLLPHHVYRMIFEIGETISVLVNKYKESFVKVC